MTVNTGQICFAPSRVYVQDGIYDRFLQAYTARFSAKTKLIGHPENPGSEIGPVVDRAQFDRIIGIIDSARAEDQGTLLMGGKRIGEKVTLRASIPAI
jgi:acyl-CoA reductase-like NAD-dependent aldehyde dehydrogenase